MTITHLTYHRLDSNICHPCPLESSDVTAQKNVILFTTIISHILSFYVDYKFITEKESRPINKPTFGKE